MLAVKKVKTASMLLCDVSHSHIVIYVLSVNAKHSQIKDNQTKKEEEKKIRFHVTSKFIDKILDYKTARFLAEKFCIVDLSEINWEQIIIFWYRQYDKRLGIDSDSIKFPCRFLVVS